ncbi:hypothetical protein BDW66DRAFT_83067 [Aspergillus desertorum]
MHILPLLSSCYFPSPGTRLFRIPFLIGLVCGCDLSLSELRLSSNCLSLHRRYIQAGPYTFTSHMPSAHLSTLGLCVTLRFRSCKISRRASVYISVFSSPRLVASAAYRTTYTFVPRSAGLIRSTWFLNQTTQLASGSHPLGLSHGVDSSSSNGPISFRESLRFRSYFPVAISWFSWLMFLLLLVTLFPCSIPPVGFQVQ